MKHQKGSGIFLGVSVPTWQLCTNAHEATGSTWVKN